MIQGTSSGAGKTTLVTALCRIFSDSGYNVVPFKSQNMSNFSYKGEGFEISRAQAIQAVAARSDITPDINPIMLKPLGNYRSSVYVNGKFYKKMHADDYYKKFVLSRGLKAVTKSLNVLKKNHDLIIVEGAGSPAEINIEKFDITNMRIAQYLSAPVILISDIDRGGSFASMVGTLELLDKRYRDLIKGFVVNKFRGDHSILKPGFVKITKKTGKSILGTIPMTKYVLPDEDSLDANPKEIIWNKKNLKKMDSIIDKLSKLVGTCVNIKKIEGFLK